MTIFAGMGPSYSIRATVASSSEFDPAAVSSPRLVVRDPRGGRSEWPATITAQSSSSVSVTAPFPDEQPHMSGRWKAFVLFTAPGGTKRSNPFEFDVQPEI